MLLDIDLMKLDIESLFVIQCWTRAELDWDFDKLIDVCELLSYKFVCHWL